MKTTGSTGRKYLEGGDSQTLRPGMIITARKLRDENSVLKRKDLKVVEARDAVPATSSQVCRYHPCSTADKQLLLGSIIPGNHQGA